MPIKATELNNLLIESHYPDENRKQLIDGFKFGFDIGYHGPTNRRDTSNNLPFKVGNKTQLWNKVMKEVELKRYAGPYKFDELPVTNFIQSPVGLVPKSGNKTRLIFHLSFDFGTDIEQKSVNYHTPKHLCSVHYHDLDHAIKNCLKLLEWCKNEKATLWYSKSDCCSAFRLVPTLPEQRKFLLLMAGHPVSGLKYYFIDLCLPFGSSISCARFQQFSDALTHIAQYKISSIIVCPIAITNYLDDFLFIALCQIICNQSVDQFIVICAQIGCPLSMEKTERASTLMTFLGILLNGKHKLLSIPEEKRNKALTLINYAVSKRKVTIKFIQQLAGTLNFLGRAIVPGRAFTRNMYHKTKTTDREGNQLKAYHHVWLDTEFISDCLVWKKFLLDHSNVGICRPFVDFAAESSKMLNFASDASKSRVLGMGAVFNNHWIIAQWPEGYISDLDPSIEFLELYALTMAVLTWSWKPQMHNCRVTIFCDNEAVVHMINNSASSCVQCMKLIRIIVKDNLA